MRWCVVWLGLGCCVGPGCTFVRPAVVHRYTFDYNTERQLAWQHETYDERPLKPGRIRLMSWAYNATTSPFAIGPAGSTTVAMGPESATGPSTVSPEMNSPRGREPDAILPQPVPPQPVPPQRLPPAPVLPGRTTRDELLRSAPPDWQLPEDEESLSPAPAQPSSPSETAMPPIAQTAGSEGTSGQAANQPAALTPAAISSAGALRPSAAAKSAKLPPGGFLFRNQ